MTPSKPNARYKPETHERILDIASELLETRGYNAFSYQDIADQLGLKKASLHYHFPTKAHLCTALAQRNADRARAILAGIDATQGTPTQKLDGFIAPFIDIATRCDRMCPGGILAAEFSTLDSEIQSRVQMFFEILQTWLARVLTEGRDAGDFTFTGSARAKADFFIATLEGAILLARIRQDAAFLTPLVQGLKSTVTL